ncbi:hypothetical protein [Streptacidiphilus anmyonensis]|uniref:hypothetical protein n=1 Tax=Streptacidiphilus anmyonensis TaxID=405782 RepID=UPI0005A6FB9D|nr:hypothetical protein [Streptacidiphilus anmyonensis]
MTSYDGRPGGGRDEDDDGVTSSLQVRPRYDQLMADIGAYIRDRPTPNLQRSTARRIAHVVIQLGDDIAEASARSGGHP